MTSTTRSGVLGLGSSTQREGVRSRATLRVEVYALSLRTASFVSVAFRSGSSSVVHSFEDTSSAHPLGCSSGLSSGNETRHSACAPMCLGSSGDLRARPGEPRLASLHLLPPSNSGCRDRPNVRCPGRSGALQSRLARQTRSQKKLETIQCKTPGASMAKQNSGSPNFGLASDDPLRVVPETAHACTLQTDAHKLTQPSPIAHPPLLTCTCRLPLPRSDHGPRLLQQNRMERKSTEQNRAHIEIDRYLTYACIRNRAPMRMHTCKQEYMHL